LLSQLTCEPHDELLEIKRSLQECHPQTTSEHLLHFWSQVEEESAKQRFALFLSKCSQQSGSIFLCGFRHHGFCDLPAEPAVLGQPEVKKLVHGRGFAGRIPSKQSRDQRPRQVIRSEAGENMALEMLAALDKGLDLTVANAVDEPRQVRYICREKERETAIVTRFAHDCGYPESGV
jgi:hypothetical protein